MSFDFDQHEQANISAADFAIMCNEIATLKQQLEESNKEFIACSNVLNSSERRVEELEQQNAELLAALKMVEWVEYECPDYGIQEFCPNCCMEKKHGHYECRIDAAIASAEGRK
jgi:hypothetical protein